MEKISDNFDKPAVLAVCACVYSVTVEWMKECVAMVKTDDAKSGQEEARSPLMGQ